MNTSARSNRRQTPFNVIITCEAKKSNNIENLKNKLNEQKEESNIEINKIKTKTTIYQKRNVTKENKILNQNQELKRIKSVNEGLEKIIQDLKGDVDKQSQDADNQKKSKILVSDIYIKDYKEKDIMLTTLKKAHETGGDIGALLDG